MKPIFFKDIRSEDKPFIGGKAWNLSQLVQLNVPVPNGFVIPATTKFSDPEISKEILEKARELYSETYAVRSSANVEDSGTHSFAGQFMTQLSVPFSELVAAVQKGFESADSQQVHEYLRQNSLKNEIVKMAIIVQKQLNSFASGIAFSAHPLTGNKDQIVVEGGYGLGELFVSGQATPFTWVIEKESEEVLENIPGSQEEQLVIDTGRVVSKKRLSKNLLDPLTKDQLTTLVSLVKKIENNYSTPQDIEWAIEDDEVFILQARPITTL